MDREEIKGTAETSKVVSVSDITRQIKQSLEQRFARVWVQGEVSNFKRHTSGHLYFTLKDAAAQLRCICLRQQARYLKFQPEDGLQVTARGRVSVYEPRGEYQLYVEFLEPQGVGALQLAFEQLKQRLIAEGLFDAARKKPLPRLPRRIGIITSPRGAVVQDILRILERRHKNLHLVIYPVRVQGEGAADEIIEAMRYFHRTPPRGMQVDVLILARGGGSLEDLWAFNEEKLARAIAASTVPVISAVGHETDFTIADFVADLRAPTPSAAAELVIETEQQLEQQITGHEESLRRLVRYYLLRQRQQLTEWMTHEAFQSLRALVAQNAQRSDEALAELLEVSRERLREARRAWEAPHAFLQHLDLRGRLQRARLEWGREVAGLEHQLQRVLAAQRARLEPLAAQMEHFNPQRVLERGYAIVFDPAGNILKDARQAAPGQPITAQLAKGRLRARVEESSPAEG